MDCHGRADRAAAAIVVATAVIVAAAVSAVIVGLVVVVAFATEVVAFAVVGRRVVVVVVVVGDIVVAAAVAVVAAVDVVAVVVESHDPVHQQMFGYVEQENCVPVFPWQAVQIRPGFSSQTKGWAGHSSMQCSLIEIVAAAAAVVVAEVADGSIDVVVVVGTVTAVSIDCNTSVYRRLTEWSRHSCKSMIDSGCCCASHRRSY